VAEVKPSVAEVEKALEGKLLHTRVLVAAVIENASSDCKQLIVGAFQGEEGDPWARGQQTWEF
jgi:hypothetical protein